MFRKCLASLALLSLLVSVPAAQDAKTTIASAAKAIGADTLKTVEFSATGFDFALGQHPNANAPWPKFIEKSYTRAIDFEAGASRVDRVRLQAEQPPRGGGQQPVIGEQRQNQTILVNPATPWVQQLELWMMPHGFLRAAAARNGTVDTAADQQGRRHPVIKFVGDNKAQVIAHLNNDSLIERIETVIDHPVVGDMPFESIYTEYKDVGGAKFPMHIVQRQGGYPIFDLRVSDVKVNAPVAIQALPASPPAANPPTQSEMLSPGVYLITGGYAVIAVDLGDHIAMVESGQNEARALAVIAEAKRVIPGKPIRYLINTHPHYDHAGGLRAFVAEGTTILTHQSNKAHLERLLALPHTLNPDKAQQAKRAPIVEGVGDKKVLTDGTRTIELYHLQNFLHHEGMLVAYLPKEKVLLEADGYNPQPTTAVPPNPPSPYTLSLADNIRRLKLDVQRIVPVHYPADNRVVTLTELQKWVGRAN